MRWPGVPRDSLKAWGGIEDFGGGWKIRKMLFVNKRFDPFV